jgi:hypothetical protein
VTAIGIELPYERWVAGEGFGCREFGRFVISPPTTGSTKGLLLEGQRRRESTPSPEAAERPAPQRAMTRFALARVSRNDCISSGVMVSRDSGDQHRQACIALSRNI